MSCGVAVRRINRMIEFPLFRISNLASVCLPLRNINSQTFQRFLDRAKSFKVNSEGKRDKEASHCSKNKKSKQKLKRVAVSPYQIYVASNFQKLYKSGLRPKEAIMQVARKWNALLDCERKVFQEKSEKLKSLLERYGGLEEKLPLPIASPKFSSEWWALAEDVKEKYVEKANRMKSNVKDLIKKKPAGFDLFLEQHDWGENTVKAVNHLIQLWNLLPGEKKEEYKKQSSS
ncbi:uncharacterized protein LOC135146032 isoform X2 [Zophobas morio]|uniref:uncharacterized protein LOC135146032 isoform X2 n=1 Tax=Zophobas morio TaxID=2755281 RepID=UPI003082E255